MIGYKFYNVCTARSKDRAKVEYAEKCTEEGDDDAVNSAINQLNLMQVPPDVARKLGLSENWKDKISPEFIERVAKTANKNSRALKELSKY